MKKDWGKERGTNGEIGISGDEGLNKISYKSISEFQERDSDLFFDNLVWMTTADAAAYLRKSVGAIRVMVHRGQLKSWKFHRRLYFKKLELDRLIETSSFLKGGI